MKVITFFSQKGGSGKTTLAVHCAVAAEAAREAVVVLDADPQGSAQAWAGARAAETPVVRGVSPVEIGAWLKEAEAAHASLVIIDAPPHAALSAPDFVRHADLVVIPVRPTVLDLAALPRAVQIVEAHKGRGVFVLSAAKPRVSETEEVRVALEEGYPLPCARTVIYDRTAFTRALASGRAVTEFEPKGQAAAEISALWTELRRMMK